MGPHLALSRAEPAPQHGIRAPNSASLPILFKRPETGAPAAGYFPSRPGRILYLTARGTFPQGPGAGTGFRPSASIRSQVSDARYSEPETWHPYRIPIPEGKAGIPAGFPVHVPKNPPMGLASETAPTSIDSATPPVNMSPGLLGPGAGLPGRPSLTCCTGSQDRDLAFPRPSYHNRGARLLGGHVSMARAPGARYAGLAHYADMGGRALFRYVCSIEMVRILITGHPVPGL